MAIKLDGNKLDFQQDNFTGEVWDLSPFVQNSHQLLKHMEVCHKGRQALYSELR